MKAALYARVSSERQAEKDLSISAQIKALRGYAVNHDHEIAKEFIDEAESARTANRPAFQEMISWAKQKSKPFDIILVWKLSRFARNREHSIIYKSLLRRHGVQIVSINEQVDDSPSGKLFEGMIEVIDEFYSTNLAQDTKRGMRESASRGFFSGGIPPIGYKVEKTKVGNVSKGRLVIDDASSAIVKRIFKLALAGNGAKEITKQFNREGLKTNRDKPWNKNMILYVLKNETYQGMLIWGKSDTSVPCIRRENNHPAIVSKADFERVQQMISERSPENCRPRTLTSSYLLSGLIYCGHCGYSLQGCPAKSGKFHYYACINSIRRGKTECNSKMVNRDRVETIVIDQLKRRVLTEENLTELLRLTNEELLTTQSNHSGDIEELEREIARQLKKLDNLYRAIESGKVDIEDLAPRIRELRQGIDESRERRCELLVKAVKPLKIMTRSGLRLYVNDLRELLSEGSVFERKGFIKSFVKRITVKDGKVTMTYTYPTGGNNGGSGGGVLSSAKESSPGRT